MYTQIENKKTKLLESSASDISENQGNTFHVEHKRLKYKPLQYNMRKFKATTKTGIEYFFAPSLDQARKMFFQNYPCGIITGLIEVDHTIY